MNRCCKWNHIQFVLSLTLAVAAATVFVSCIGAPTPAPVVGPGLSGNDPPTLQITKPTADVTADQGANFLIQWTDSDADNNAQISFSLVNTETNQAILLVAGVDENDSTGPDTFTVSTSLIPIGTYNLRGTIDDSVNAIVTVFSETSSANITQRTVIRIVEPGRGQQTVPPTVTVTEPAFNQSVAQDDILRVSVQPTEFAPLAALPFDPDSAITLFILLDIDLDPDNDDPTNPDPSQIIVLQTRSVEAGSFEAINFDIPIDLTTIPPRADGEPYFIRVTADDLTNPRVHQYAVGTISVAQLAAGEVDLFDVGRAVSGVRFYGFNPGAELGSSMTTLTDFDADGVDDFVLVAQFGNPRNFGLIGEAYTIYGQDRVRFGGAIGVNSIGEAISGAIFSAPPVRTNFSTSLEDRDARTDGITTVSFMSDLSGDGRPEILFGLQHVHGAFDSMDYDPGDDMANDFIALGCYPDTIVNNTTDQPDGLQADTYFYAGGMALMINSQNRDNRGSSSDRLESTVVDMELVGSRVLQPLDAGGFNVAGPIFARADNSSAVNLGNETMQMARISGARFFAGGFDFIDPFGLDQGPREGLFGQKVSRLGDLNSDGLEEIMVSAPTNESYVDSLFSRFGFASTQWRSSIFRASITVFPGTNYNLNTWRDKSDNQNGTSNTPQLDQSKIPPFGKCSATVGTQAPRHYSIPADTFGVFAEDTSDFLGGAVSAGDFNQDGIDDILCGAPLNDRTNSVSDSGAVYVLYGRNVPGDVKLSNADSSLLRSPMLRIRGVKTGDQIGFTQAAGLDVNGDRIKDIFISSPSTDFGAIRRTTCAGDFNGDGEITNSDLNQVSFDACRAANTHVFSDESCKSFDYDNNGMVDSGDSDIFLCLIAGGANCCDTAVDNGFVAVIFGGVFLDGDRTIDQIATAELPGAVFFGSGVGHRAGTSIASAGDFNQDGFGDLLITAPGEVRIDSTGRERLGVVYLVFGGPHLENTTWNLSQVASPDLPGIVFLSPYAKGRPNEAAPVAVAGIGDINNDGFDDIAIGNPKADFIDLSFPQGPDATDAELGRRRDSGDAYIVYGNNFGRNRVLPN